MTERTFVTYGITRNDSFTGEGGIQACQASRGKSYYPLLAIAIRTIPRIVRIIAGGMVPLVVPTKKIHTARAIQITPTISRALFMSLLRTVVFIGASQHYLFFSILIPSIIERSAPTPIKE